jgi:hypothetical protein
MVWVLNAIELFTCIIAFVYYNKLRATRWRLLPFYLLAIIALELLGRYLGSTPELRKYNPLMFNYISFPLQFLFFYWIFYTDVYFAENKKHIWGCIILYLLALVADAVYFTNKSYFFHSFSYSIGNIILLLLLMKYFYKLSTSDDILKFSENIMFWFCLGVLIYYVGTLPLWALRNVLVFQHPGIFLKYSYTSQVLDYLMYSLFTIGIIRCKLK